MSRWLSYPANRKLTEIPVSERVASPCGRFIAAFYLVSSNDDEESDGGMHEIMIYDAASGEAIAQVKRAWRVNYRTDYRSGLETYEVGFSEDGETLLINRGKGDACRNVPFWAALKAIDRHRQDDPGAALVYINGDDDHYFVHKTAEMITEPIEYADLINLVRFRLRSGIGDVGWRMWLAQFVNFCNSIMPPSLRN